MTFDENFAIYSCAKYFNLMSVGFPVEPSLSQPLILMLTRGMCPYLIIIALSAFLFDRITLQQATQRKQGSLDYLTGSG